MRLFTALTGLLVAATAYTLFAAIRTRQLALALASTSTGTDPSCTKPFTYRGKDYPRAWCLPPLSPATLAYEDGNQYHIHEPLGQAAWNATLPTGGAVLHLGPDRRPFTLSFFHQLRCLDIIRAAAVAYHASDVLDPKDAMGEREMRLTEHCMNYMRQTVMCRADLTIESVRNLGAHRAVSDISRSCKDWTSVYAAAEENYEQSRS